MALKPLTVNFNEPALLARLNAENKGADERLYRDGPANPQALNRYSYVLNNPVRWTDLTGHVVCHKNPDACRDRLSEWADEHIGKPIRGLMQGIANVATVFIIDLLGGDIAWWGEKIAQQMPRRGWKDNDIKDVLERPSDTAKTVNRSTGNTATKYYRSDGHYIVRDDVTGEVIQISNRYDPGWIDDLTNLPVGPR